MNPHKKLLLLITLSSVLFTGVSNQSGAQYTPPGWNTVANISNTAGYWDVDVVYELDSNGKLHVFWTMDWRQIYYATNASGSWVNTMLINNAQYPRMKITPDQIIHLIYNNKSDGGLYYINKPVSGGSWSTPINIANQTDNKGLWGDIAMDTSGGIYVCWYTLWNDNLNPRSSLWGRYLPFQGTWGNTELIVGINHKDDWPMGGHLSSYNMTFYCCYEMTGSNRPTMTYKVRPPGGPWGSEKQVPHISGSGGICFEFSPSGEMACGYARNLAASGQGLQYEVFVKFSNDFGTTWTDEFQVSPNSWLSRGPISMAYDSAGNFHIAWQRNLYDGDDFDMWYRSRVGGLWQSSVNLTNSPNGKFTGAPSHSLKARGNDLHFIYADNDSILIPDGTGEYYYIWKQGSNDTTPPASPNPFVAAPGEKRVQLTWTNPADTDYTTTMVRRKTGSYPSGPFDGTFICNKPGTPGSNDSFLDYPLSVGTPYLYAAFAMDSSGNWSAAAQSTATPVPDVTPPVNVASFTAVPYTHNNVILNWQNPANVDFKGTRIMFKTTGYPTGPNDGTLVCQKAAAPGSNDSFIHQNLTPGITHYYRAFAYDEEPNYSSGSDAQAIPVFVTCGYLKSLPSGTYQELYSKVVSGVYPADSAIYVQESDRSSGMRVPYSGSGLSVGDLVNVAGPLMMRQLNGVNSEMTFQYATVSKVSAATAPVPLRVSCKQVGGKDLPGIPGVKDSTGTHNMGLLVTIAGKVTYASGQYIFVDDGSKVDNVWGLSTPTTGVMIKGPSSTSAYAVGSIVRVTGVIVGSVPNGWTTNRAFIQTRDWTNDVVTLAPPPIGSIAGVVRDQASNALPGASVTTSTGGYSATTNASGAYTINGVEPGSYNVTASKTGYSSQTQNGISVSAYNTTTLDFNLTATSGTISGVIRDQANNAVSGATVSTNTGGYTTTTDSSGAYTLSAVAPATYTVTASKSGYTSNSQTGVVVSAGQTTTVNLNITALPGSISGTVKDAGNNAISGATVSTNSGGYSATTDASGGYTLSNVSAGTYNVTATKAGFNPSTINNVTVSPGQVVSGINFTLQLPPGNIAGVVRDQVNNPVSGATISTNMGGYTTTTNASGAFTLSGVNVGTYNVTASKSGYISHTVNGVSVTSGATTNVDFNITQNIGTITGTVKDAGNNAISGATVSTSSGGYTTTSNASGAYTLSGVAGGTYTVTASKSGYVPHSVSGVTVTAQQTTTVNFTLTYLTEKLVNGNFESGSFSFWGGTIGNNWGACWKNTSSPPYTWNVETVDGSKVQRVRVESSSYQMGIGQSVSGLTPGAPYILTASAKRVADNYGVFIAVVDGVGGVTLPATGTAIPVVTNSWASGQVTGTVPANGSVTVYIWAWKDNWGSNAAVYFDNMSLLSY